MTKTPHDHRPHGDGRIREGDEALTNHEQNRWKLIPERIDELQRDVDKLLCSLNVYECAAMRDMLSDELKDFDERELRTPQGEPTATPGAIQGSLPSVETAKDSRPRELLTSNERSRFEGWADNNGYGLRRKSAPFTNSADTNGDYTDTSTQDAWEAWQARAALSGDSSAPETEAKP